MEKTIKAAPHGEYIIVEVVQNENPLLNAVSKEVNAVIKAVSSDYDSSILVGRSVLLDNWQGAIPYKEGDKEYKIFRMNHIILFINN